MKGRLLSCSKMVVKKSFLMKYILLRRLYLIILET